MLSHSHSYSFVPFLLRALGHSDFDILPLAGDASARKYFRIVLKDNHSMVLMVWDPFIDNDDYPFLSVLQHFAQHRVHVPQVVAKSPAEGLVLLEDLGDLTLERKFWETQNQEMVLPFYREAIDELIKIHYPATEDKNNCTAFRIAFDVPRLLWELDYGRKHYLIDLAQIQFTDAEKTMLDRVFLDICTRLDAEPKRIAHRDYHSRNVMIKLNKLFVIDFQDARMGPVQYDLVSLLKDSYVQLDADIREILLNYYLSESQRFVPPTDRRHFDLIYNLQTLQRCFKACGSFASFKVLRNDNRYLKYIQGTIQHVRQSLSHFPEYKEFAQFIDQHQLCERNFENP